MSISGWFRRKNPSPLAIGSWTVRSFLLQSRYANPFLQSTVCLLAQVLCSALPVLHLLAHESLGTLQASNSPCRPLLLCLLNWRQLPKWNIKKIDELTKELAQGKYSPRLGELLLDKAEEGVVVNLMQWDDFSSNALQQTGKMGTYDEHTRNFFKGTKVNARFMSMAGGETNTILEGLNKTMAFTHHQKFIIMDAPKSNGNGRELLAFVGGIDLTEGRWDNRQVRRMIYSHLVVLAVH